MTKAGTLDIKTVLEQSAKYRNWGKWGPDDELGTINYITPEKVVAARRAGAARARSSRSPSPSTATAR